MPKVKKAGIRKLKSELSAYLRMVQAGTTVLVYDRDVCVAELRRPADVLHNSVLQAWANAEEVTLPTAKRFRFGPCPANIASGLAQRILDAEREE
jgi:antitoxin (DNA-binding transcriptional repressor) of toxin-antitoxin stability system